MADEDRAARIAREVVLSAFAGEARGLRWVFQRISGAMEDVYLERGDVAFTAGEPPSHQYFIVDGEVELTAPGKRTLTFGPKSVVGTMDALLDQPMSRTATARQPTHILRMKSEDWFDILEDSFELSRLIIRNLGDGLAALRLRPPPLGGFDDLPQAQRREVTRDLHLVDRILLLRDVPIFSRASIQTLTSLAEISTVREAKAGEILCARGEPKRDLLVLASGEVSMTPEAPAPAGRFGPGALVGGSMAVGLLPAYEVRAESDVRALALAREDVIDVMEEHFGLVRSTLRALVTERLAMLARG